jgi:hypothetical protein
MVGCDITDPCEEHVLADLEDGTFKAGIEAGRWRLERSEFPYLFFVISSTEPDGSAGEYGFRAELSGFPGQAPEVQIWDIEADIPLNKDNRPKGGPRLVKSFQKWGDDTVYRPWDRRTGPHSGNARNLPHLAWHSERRLTFIFEDLHGILNSNARACRLRAKA